MKLKVMFDNAVVVQGSMETYNVGLSQASHKTIMWFATAASCAAYDAARMKIEKFWPFILSRLECDLHQQLLISTVVCKESLL